MKYVIAYAVGYFVSLGLGHVLTNYVVERLHKDCGPPREKNCEVLPKITGTLDRILYTSAWLTPYKEFIGVWLLVKVARGWRVPGQPVEQRPKGEADGKQCEISKYDVGRYNIFMIGNALCVIFGVSGGIAIRQIIKYWCS